MTTSRRAIPRPSVRDFRPPYVAPASLALPKPTTWQPGAFPEVVRYTVPGKPVGQNRGSKATTRAYGKTEAQKAYAALLAFHGSAARQRLMAGTTTAKVEVWITFHFQDERPDTDGPVKAVLDSLEVPRPRIHRPGSGWLANDRQVRRYHVDRGEPDKANPRVEVEIRPWRPTLVRVDEMEGP